MDPRNASFHWQAKFIYSFKNPVLDSGKNEEKIKILRWETLDLNLLEEMVELVWYIKNCMAHLQVKLEFLCEVLVTYV